YVRFDLNDYSIPHTHVRRVLSVLADPHEVRIVDGAEVLAVHRRSYDKGAQIEAADHVQALVEQKRAAREHRATDRLAHAVPASQTLLARAAERGANLGAITSALIRLLDRNSAADLQAAILEALERDVPHPNAVRLALEHRREQRGQAPQVDLALPEHVQRRDAPVRPPLSAISRGVEPSFAVGCFPARTRSTRCLPVSSTGPRPPPWGRSSTGPGWTRSRISSNRRRSRARKSCRAARWPTSAPAITSSRPA